jgi:hypothetical protein
MLLSTECSLLRAEGFSCSFGVLYGGLGISKLQFLIKKIEIKFPAINYLLTYDSYVPLYNRFHRGEWITMVRGGRGPWTLLGPGHSWALKWHKRSECHLGPGVSRAPSPPLTQVILAPL